MIKNRNAAFLEKELKKNGVYLFCEKKCISDEVLTMTTFFFL